MSKGTKIARAYSRAHDKLRSIFMEGVCLKVLSGDQHQTTLATYTSHWYLDKREYLEPVAGGVKRFKRLVIDDLEGCRLANLRNMTAVQVGDTVFKFHAKDSFLGSVPSYEFKVYPTGERV